MKIKIVSDSSSNVYTLEGVDHSTNNNIRTCNNKIP